ncbi:leptin-B-like [Brienomyrus brachyistius]|uniref:leptin-B-like n=1 Tax=Brienomyrus brachyistius TaxID=42636 RepID=UPI0020B2379B|nr:leptin-B-like [Brienomyrus brachyistius]
MKSSMTLLYSSILMLLATSVSRPLAVDIVKNQVKFMAQTTVVRIQRLTDEFRISPNMVFSDLELIPDMSLDKPIEGLATIMDSLNTFQIILLNLQMDGVSQVHADLLSLQGIVRSLAPPLNCSLPKLKSSKHLDAFLKTNAAFHVTITNVALDRLQKFLKKLILDLDQLKTC